MGLVSAMKYKNIEMAEFVSRPNRFVAHIIIDGQEQTAHVPNTGRCKELLLPGARVVVSKSDNPKRKLAYSLISVYKGDMLVNLDSQNPNRLVEEALCSGKLLGFSPQTVRREYTVGESRLDLMFDDPDHGKGLIEVKGCTLEIDGWAYFPDAPTLRGVKHLRELTAAKREGWQCYVVFAIQMKGVAGFSPNRRTHEEFAEALAEAQAAGVQVLAFDSVVLPEEVRLDEAVPVKL